MNILTPDDFPLLSQGPAIISARGTLAMCASAELAAEITARINAGEMLRSMAMPETVSGEPELSPPETDNDGWGMRTIG
jgi:hypothetical protein